MTQESVLQTHWANNTEQDRDQLIEFGHGPGQHYRLWYWIQERFHLILSAFLKERYNIFYHDVGEISDLSQSEAPNLVMWRVMVMQPRPRLLGDEVVVGPNLMFRKMDPWNVNRNILQDKTDKNQL